PPELVRPDDGIEFRPNLASAVPRRKGLTVLFVDLLKVPVNSTVHIKLVKAPDKLTMLNGDTPVTSFSAKVESKYVIEGHSIAKIPISFRGHGKGQKAEIEAKVKVKDGSKYTASGILQIRETIEGDAGLFRKVEYTALYDNPMSASQFADEDGVIHINSIHPTNQLFFGESDLSFSRQIHSETGAKIRLVDVILDEVMYYALSTKEHMGGNEGWYPDEEDVVSSVRRQIEKWKHTEGRKLFSIFLKSAGNLIGT
ncbi:MAG: hypothetical protein IIB00_02785, partial [candidate division Zixibacteria bacterium]|nr:hypothetical protein [candidate division Zixibacteria bacterium]